jgi:hypothetical protein
VRTTTPGTPGDEHGPGRPNSATEPGDDRGHTTAPGDDRSQTTEPGDDRGQTIEPGDDSDGHGGGSSGGSGRGR